MPDAASDTSSPRPLKRELLARGVRRRWLLLLPGGDEVPLADAAPARYANAPAVRSIVAAVLEKGVARPSSASFELLRRMQWADHEPASDAGHLRFYPRGALIYNLLRDWMERWLTEELGCALIQTPRLFDWSSPRVRAHAATFDDQLYFARAPGKDRDFVLRCGGDFGLVQALEGARLGYRQLPLRLVELADSYRYFRRGKLTGIHRLRAFSFFDGHSLCADLDQGWREFRAYLEAQDTLLRALGMQLGCHLAAVEGFYQQHRGEVHALVAALDTPVVLELVDTATNYWAMKQHGTEEHGYRLFNLQLDQVSGPKHGITYTTASGSKAACVLCHNSWGSIERWFFVFVERALEQSPPRLPLWLAPTQVRLVPVSDDQVDACLDAARILRRLNVRADVDDRARSVSWRVRAARSAWVPFVVLRGPRDEGAATLQVDVRGGQRTAMTLEALAEHVRAHTEGMPWRPLSLPPRLTRQPAFR